MRKSNYKKPTTLSQSVLATVKTLLTVAVLAVTVMFIYFVSVNGWQSIVDWFKGKYFTMVIVILLFVAVGAWWIYSFVKRIKGTMENDE